MNLRIIGALNDTDIELKATRHDAGGKEDVMTHVRRWNCLSEGKAWVFMKLSAIMIVIGLGMEGYLLLAHGPDTLGGYLRFLFLAFWSGVIGIASFALATIWLLTRSMTACR